VVAAHSPILLALPGATIYQIGEDPARHRLVRANGIHGRKVVTLDVVNLQVEQRHIQSARQIDESLGIHLGGAHLGMQLGSPGVVENTIRLAWVAYSPTQ
jgi:hypothetical protein